MDVGLAAGMSHSAYRTCEHTRENVSVERALRWLEFIKQMPDGDSRSSNLGHSHNTAKARSKSDLLAPTDPRAVLESCIQQDEARLLFLQTQAAEVEKRIAQTKAALACFAPDAAASRDDARCAPDAAEELR